MTRKFIIVLAITTLFTRWWSASPGFTFPNCFANACYGPMKTAFQLTRQLEYAASKTCPI